MDFIPGITYPVYEAKKFNQKTNKFEVEFRQLEEEIRKTNFELSLAFKREEYENAWEASVNSYNNIIYLR